MGNGTSGESRRLVIRRGAIPRKTQPKPSPSSLRTDHLSPRDRSSTAPGAAARRRRNRNRGEGMRGRNHPWSADRAAPARAWQVDLTSSIEARGRKRHQRAAKRRQSNENKPPGLGPRRGYKGGASERANERARATILRRRFRRSSGRTPMPPVTTPSRRTGAFRVGRLPPAAPKTRRKPLGRDGRGKARGDGDKGPRAIDRFALFFTR
jgi:hypothetical protein